MHSISCLIFNSRIPPGIEVDHVVGSGQVQAGAPRLERDQEQITLAILQVLHSELTRLCHDVSYEPV